MEGSALKVPQLGVVEEEGDVLRSTLKVLPLLSNDCPNGRNGSK